MADSQRDKEFIIHEGRMVSRVVSAYSANLSDGIVWYVDIEHDRAIVNPPQKAMFDEVRYDRAMMCSRASGLPCEAVHYHDATLQNAIDRQVRAICISGNTTDWVHYDFQQFQPLMDSINSGTMPVLALCGGHQLLALAYGGKCGAIRKLEPGEPECVVWAQGFFAEVGFLPIQIIQPDPVFEGLQQPPVFFESHYWEIKELPEEFVLLASTQAVRCQVIKHRTFPVYGTQFHPEVNDAQHPDGFTLLHNFFKMAKTIR